MRFAIIGAGAGVFRRHLAALEQLREQIVALVDMHTFPGAQRAQALHCPFYEDYHEMLREVKPDMAVILTPPFLHASLTIACLQAGCHVLVEKPMALHVMEAEEMIATARACQRLLGVVFQQRLRPEVLAAKALLEAGQLGQLQHVEAMVSCPRPAAYYRAKKWRGTWAGEGGGVLMNQAPHSLDLLCYLVGMPVRAVAWTHRQLHAIEAEDSVQAMLEWPDGVPGSFAASTAWTSGEVAEPASEQATFHLIGTAGSLRLCNGLLNVMRLDKEMQTFARASLQPFPVAEPLSIPLPRSQGDHATVYRHFCAAIHGQTSLVVTGEAARQSLELANGLLLSAHTGEQVVFPLDGARYAAFLAERQRTSRSRTRSSSFVPQNVC